MRRVAAIDCGTNSIRLLVAETTPELRDLAREMRIVRLGQGVNETGTLAPEAIARTLAAVEEYAEIMDALNVEEARFVATSAMRDADNGEEFVSTVRSILGITPEVITGSEEASLTFRGATAFIAGQQHPTLVVDIGGGSTEFVLGSETVSQSVSVDMGSVRVHEMFDTPDEARPWIDSQLDRVTFLEDVRSIVGVAGTVTTLAACALDLDTYSPDVTHGKFLSWDEWYETIRYMEFAPLKEKESLGYMPKGRADVIASGAVIWERVLRRLQGRSHDLGGAYISEHDILDGMVLAP